MKITKELRSLSAEELHKRLQEMRKEVLKLSVQASTGTMAGSSGKAKQRRKNIARILTLLQEKGVER